VRAAEAQHVVQTAEGRRGVVRCSAVRAAEAQHVVQTAEGRRHMCARYIPPRCQHSGAAVCEPHALLSLSHTQSTHSTVPPSARSSLSVCASHSHSAPSTRTTATQLACATYLGANRACDRVVRARAARVRTRLRSCRCLAPVPRHLFHDIIIAKSLIRSI
jgi:hypothetical protein